MKERIFTPLNRRRLLWAAVYGLLAVAAVLLLWVIYRRTAQKPAAAEKQAGM